MNDNQTNACNYRIDAPYPPVRVNGSNSAYACAMLSDMADVVSEMSDVTRYFYVAVVAKPKYDWVSKCFNNISIVEMYHLNIFAELALLLGANPRLCNGRKWWSPAFIAYPHEIQALVAESIKAEEDAIRKYSRQANIIGDINIAEILRRIVLDEERHLQIFREIYQQISS